MGDKVNMVRPDGSIIAVDPSERDALEALGHRPEEFGEGLVRNEQAANEAYYSTTDQQIKTGFEGVASGLTLGLSDLALSATDSDFAERAQYNPGIRLGSEIVGGLLPLVPGASLLKFTPAGALMRGASAAGKAATAGRVGQVAIAGAIEGGGFGAGSALAEASIAGDPLTTEAVMAGVGWGAVFGGGLGALAGKATAHLEGRAAAKAAGEAANASHSAATRDAWLGVRGAVDDVTGQLNQAVKDASSALDNAKAELKLGNRQFEDAKRAYKAVNSLDEEAVKATNAEGRAAVDADNALGRDTAEVANWAGTESTKALNRQGAEQAATHNTMKTEMAHGRAQGAVDEAAKVRNGFFNEMTLKGVEDAAPAFKSNKKEGIRAFNDMKAALKSKDYVALEKAQQRFIDHVKAINDDLGKLAEGDLHYQMRLEAFPNQAIKPAKVPKPFKNSPVELDEFTPQTFSPRGFTPKEFTPHPFSPMAINAVRPFEEMTLKGADTAFKEMTGLAKAAAGLKGFPTTMDDFGRMTPQRAERVAGALDTFLKTSTPEFHGLREGLKDSLGRLQEAMGVAIDGTPALQFRGLYEASRGISQRAATEAVEKANKGILPWMSHQAANSVGSAAGRSVGGKGIMRAAAYSGGRALTLGLLGLKAAVVGGITKAAKDWAPRAAVALGTKGSRIEPLATRLDGLEDKGSTDRLALMKARSEEIRASAGSVRDILYKNVQPLAEAHPELASAMHAHGVKRFTFILDKLPKDPGLAYSRLQSLWKPDTVATEKFSRYYEVFQNPMAVVQKILQTGRCLPEHIEGLREMDPALFGHLRMEMLTKVSDPAVMNKLSYPEQVSIGTMLDLPLHSTMTPQFVATQQQMYMEKNQAIPMPPQPGQAGGGGRPPGASKGATSAQKITEH